MPLWGHAQILRKQICIQEKTNWILECFQSGIRFLEAVGAPFKSMAACRQFHPLDQNFRSARPSSQVITTITTAPAT